MSIGLQLACVVPALVPALVLPTSSHVWTSPSVRCQPIEALMMPSRPGDLSEMYRARWLSHDDDKVNEIADEDTNLKIKDVAPAMIGATVGVGSMAVIGAFKSVAFTEKSFELIRQSWGYAGSHDISIFLDRITGWVAHVNAPILGVMPSFADVVFTFVVAVDIAAFTSFVILALHVIEQEKAVQQSIENPMEDELCVLTAQNDHICGPASFDSTYDYACVEQMVNGQMQWVCA